MDTVYRLRRYASEMATGLNLSSAQGGLLERAASEIEQLRASHDAISKLNHHRAKMIERLRAERNALLMVLAAASELVEHRRDSAQIHITEVKLIEAVDAEQARHLRALLRSKAPWEDQSAVEQSGGDTK